MQKTSIVRNGMIPYSALTIKRLFKKGMLCLMLFSPYWGCSEKDIIEEEAPKNELVVNFSIKSGKSHLKSGRNYEITNAEMFVRNENGIEGSYATSNVTSSTIIFLIPDGVYTIKELYLTDQDGKRILYLEDEIKVNTTNGGLGDITLAEIIESFWFDWETATYVSNNNTLPRLPWISGASTGVPRQIALDHKKVDGWELVHNNFTLLSGNSEPRIKYFLLYNKFTGFLRMWYWHEGATSYSSLKYSIQHLAQSSMLNFNGDFALPMDSREPKFSEYLSGDGTIQSGQGITQFTWYMFEYELAYDKEVPNIAKDKSDLFIAARGIDVKMLELTGSQTGKITGKIIFNAPNSSIFNVSSLVFNNTQNNNSHNNTISTTSTNATTNNSVNWWQQVKNKLTVKTAEQIGNAGGTLASGLLNLATNPIGKYLNSLVHQNTGDQGSVNLSMSTKINISGNLTSEAPVLSLNLHVPGIKSRTGLTYLYDEPLGVFNLNTQPVVNYQQAYYYRGTPNPRYFQYFSIDRSSFNFIVNPAIVNNITILEQKTELYFYKRYEGHTELKPLEGIGNVEVGAQNKLVYETIYETPYGTAMTAIPHNKGFEYYKFEEGAIPPVATTALGLCWSGKLMPSNYFIYFPKLPPDRRIVVKAILRFRVNQTGRDVTIVKTFIPKIVEHQTLSLTY